MKNKKEIGVKVFVTVFAVVFFTSQHTVSSQVLVASPVVDASEEVSVPQTNPVLPEGDEENVIPTSPISPIGNEDEEGSGIPTSPVFPEDDNTEETTLPPVDNENTAPPTSPVFPEDQNDDEDENTAPPTSPVFPEDQNDIEPTDSDNGGSSGGGSSSGSVATNSFDSTAAFAVSQGEVLGANTFACTDMYLKTYIKYGEENDRFEVLKLQLFLSIFTGSEIEYTGEYDLDTFEKVKELQSLEKTTILDPWNSLEEPTGYVYKTTRHFINNYICPGSEDFPVLN